MKKQLALLTAATFFAAGATSANAANVSSVSCSLSSVVISFDSAIASGDITKVAVQAGANAKVSYDLSANLPGSVSGNDLTLTTTSDTQNELKRIPPWKAYIKVEGNGIDSGADCD